MSETHPAPSSTTKPTTVASTASVSEDESGVCCRAPWAQVEASLRSSPVAEQKEGFHRPLKLISNAMHMAKWKQSQARSDIVSYILVLNEAVKGKSMDTPLECSEVFVFPLSFFHSLSPSPILSLSLSLLLFYILVVYSYVRLLSCALSSPFFPLSLFRRLSTNSLPSSSLSLH